MGFRWWVRIAAHVPFVTIPLVFTARHVLGLGQRIPISAVEAGSAA